VEKQIEPCVKSNVTFGVHVRGVGGRVVGRIVAAQASAHVDGTSMNFTEIANNMIHQAQVHCGDATATCIRNSLPPQVFTDDADKVARKWCGSHKQWKAER
jgi:hypothetical protein